MYSMVLSYSQAQKASDSERAVIMDEAAFQHLYQLTARPLRAYLLRSCGDLELANDLLQETYLRFLKADFEGNDDAHRR